MKCNFWLTFIPKRDSEGEIESIQATNVRQTRPSKGQGIAVPFSLDMDLEIFQPLEFVGNVDAKTKVVVLTKDNMEETECTQDK